MANKLQNETSPYLKQHAHNPVQWYPWGTEALNKAKDIALSQLSEEVKDYITKNYGDIDNWLTTQIEATINLIKN